MASYQKDPTQTRRQLCLIGLAIFSLAGYLVAQAPSNVRDNWTEFMTQDMMRWNPYEHILNVSDVGNLKMLGSYTADGAALSDPAVVNGIVYVGSDNGNVYAVSARTGSLLWSYATGGTVTSSPAVADGVVYVGSYDDNVYALNATDGTKLWSYTTGNQVSSSPAVVNGVVYVSSTDSNLYALDASTGVKLWSYSTGSQSYTFSSPAVANGVVYVGSNAAFDALNAQTGVLLWSNPNIKGSFSPAVADGVVYVGAGHNLNALNGKTGTLQWTFPTSQPVDAAPAVANLVVYVESEDGNLYGLSATTGVFLWSYKTEAYMYSPAVANGVVYLSADDSVNGNGTLYALNADTGAKLWSYQTGTNSIGDPVVVNGVVYVTTNNGAATIYAFGLPRGLAKQ
jgi:outer membrane protein assembly factor BamB